MLHSIVAVILGFIIILILGNWLKNRNVHRKKINQMPGPPGKPIIGVLLDLLIPADEIWNYLRKMAATYYPIYKYWQIDIAVVNLLCPEDIEIVLSSTKHSAKSAVYDCLHPWLGTGLLTSKGSKWQSRRKILTPAFHFNILQQFIGIFAEESVSLVEHLESECDKPHTNVVPIITQFTLLTICETAMGTKLERTEKTWQDYTKAIYRMGEILLFRLTRPWYFLDATFAFSPEYREHNKLINILHTFSKSIIENRKVNFKEPELLELQNENSTTKRRLAMLDLLISAKNAGQPIDDEGIREEVDTFMFEGHDTTTACISFTLLLLACHKDIQDKVVQELQEVFGDSDRVPTYQDLQNLPYLEQVLKESLRMYPSVPFISRINDEEIKTHSGHTIPVNTILQIHIYDLHHNPKFYPEPEKFDPDRFLPENVKGRHPFAYIPFSAGPRNCIGQKFAILEIKTMISAILRKFVLEPIDTPADITMIVHLVLKTKNGIRIKFQKRLK